MLTQAHPMINHLTSDIHNFAHRSPYLKKLPLGSLGHLVHTVGALIMHRSKNNYLCDVTQE